MQLMAATPNKPTQTNNINKPAGGNPNKPNKPNNNKPNHSNKSNKPNDTKPAEPRKPIIITKNENKK